MEVKQLYCQLLIACENGNYRDVRSSLVEKCQQQIIFHNHIMNIEPLVFAASKAGNPTISRLLEDTVAKFSQKLSINFDAVENNNNQLDSNPDCGKA